MIEAGFCFILLLCLCSYSYLFLRLDCPAFCLFVFTYNTNIRAPGGIRTRNSSKRSAADPRVRPLGYWDQHVAYISSACYYLVTGKVQLKFQQETVEIMKKNIEF